MTLEPEAAWHSVQSLSQVISSGEKGVSSLPGFLTRLLEQEAWREFQPPMGGVRRPASFRQFVEAQPLNGLGTTIPTIEALLKSHPDPERRSAGLRALRAALKVGRGGSIDRTNDSDSESLVGETTDYLLQRLHDQAPELYAEVTSGRTSVNAAAVKAGFRRPTVTVRTDDPQRAVTTLLKHFTRDQLLSALESP